MFTQRRNRGPITLDFCSRADLKAFWKRGLLDCYVYELEVFQAGKFLKDSAQARKEGRQGGKEGRREGDLGTEGEHKISHGQILSSFTQVNPSPCFLLLSWKCSIIIGSSQLIWDVPLLPDFFYTFLLTEINLYI